MTLAEESAGRQTGDAEWPWLPLLRALVNVNSGFANVAGQRRVFDLLTPRFARLGFAGRDIPLPDGRLAMVYERPDAAAELLLVGHTDTMFQPDSPFQTLERAGAVLTGPGISDMKAGLVLILMLLERLNDPRLLRRVRVFINDDEELGARWSRNALRETAGETRVALVFEPGLKDGAYVLGWPAARPLPCGARALRTAMRYYGREEVPVLARHLREMTDAYAVGSADAPLPALLRRLPDERLDTSGRALLVGLGPYGGMTHTTEEFLRPETFPERLDAAERIVRTLLEPRRIGA